MKEYKEFDETATSVVVYARFGIPIPFVSDRDLCIKCVEKKIDENTTYCQVYSIDHQQCPQAKKVVRMQQIQNYLISVNKYQPDTLDYVELKYSDIFLSRK